MTPRTRAWWHAVADQAADPTPPPGSDREPWADHPSEVAALTTAQRAVLAGLDDQPEIPRLDGVDPEATVEDQPSVPRVRAATVPGEGPGNGTGSAPGDPGAGDPHTRTRWTEQEQQEG